MRLLPKKLLRLMAGNIALSTFLKQGNTLEVIAVFGFSCRARGIGGLL